MTTGTDSQSDKVNGITKTYTQWRYFENDKLLNMYFLLTRWILVFKNQIKVSLLNGATK